MTVSRKPLVQPPGKPTSKTKKEKYLFRDDSVAGHRANEVLSSQLKGKTAASYFNYNDQGQQLQRPYCSSE